MGALGLGLEITELKLGLPGEAGGCEKKRAFSGVDGDGPEVDGGGKKSRNMDLVVGWPPVCAHRKKSTREAGTKMYVKVSMDGAPILRKVDLGCFNGYSDLGLALENLFDCYGIGEAMNEESESCEYYAIYEDKDGDWMLVGDVPWPMFIEACKRLRIKKKSHVQGMDLHANGMKNEVFKITTRVR